MEPQTQLVSYLASILVADLASIREAYWVSDRKTQLASDLATNVATDLATDLASILEALKLNIYLALIISRSPLQLLCHMSHNHHGKLK